MVTKCRNGYHFTSCLFCVDSAALLILNEQQFYLFAQIKIVKQEVSCTVILPPMVCVLCINICLWHCGMWQTVSTEIENFLSVGKGSFRWAVFCIRLGWFLCMKNASRFQRSYTFLFNSIQQRTLFGVQLLTADEGKYLPKCQTNLVISLHALSILFCNFISTTAYHLGRYMPSSPSTKELHEQS